MKTYMYNIKTQYIYIGKIIVIQLHIKVITSVGIEGAFQSHLSNVSVTIPIPAPIELPTAPIAAVPVAPNPAAPTD